MNFNYISGDERETLYNEVWTEPMVTVATRYGISDSVLRRNCRRLGIPLPTSGYWAKLKAGKSVTKTPLPQVYGIYKKYVHNYVIKFKTAMENFSDNELTSDEELNLFSEETVSFIKDKCSEIKVDAKLKNPHNLILEHKEGTLLRKKREKEFKQKSLNSKYYYDEDIKNKYVGGNSILPIQVSDSNINRAYRIINALINILDKMEGSIQLIKGYEKDVAMFVIMRTIFYFEVKEEKKKTKINEQTHETKNILVLSFRAEEWLYNHFIEDYQYKDIDNEPLELQLSSVIYHMFVIANRSSAIEELNNRRCKREEEEKERQRRLEQMRNGELKDIELLEQAALDWNKAEKIRRFINCMEKSLDKVNDEIEKAKIEKWIDWSRNKADWIDPLIAKKDDLLGQNKHIFDRINDGDI
ncbi:hypothetical protein [Clostridium cellulovorans]|uniref:Uncharacterized protein n=1 Tax=Clostridium cellulovorans (strain ATCC 35296 / DSM 3052 / OCM 3 / 743B) TaxID=573061 RepID=D9SSJ7_CLOC7|nr:hypothetical protein [Clostridium cellulovorans]ADL50594.1 hypothetical protein Clocel_0824 [Clostridium cellulovorans 743B]